MIDRIFTAALIFCLLAAGTLAVGSQMFAFNHRPSAVATAQPATLIELPTVVITGQRERTSVAEAEAEAEAVRRPVE
jgi:hypothetical protein